MLCSKCKQDKPHSEFYASSGRTCKACVRARVDARRIEKAEEIAAYDRARGQLPHRKEAVKARATRYKDKPYKKDWALRNPEKRAAHVIVGNAVRDGKLAKPTVCEGCNAEGQRLHAHHDDYTKPLEVDWWCPECHGEYHRLQNEAKR